MRKNIQRIEWLDIAKGIAILLVIAGHVSLLPWEPWRKMIFSVHMPLFFIAAGVTAKSKTISSKYLIKLIERLVVPYIITAMLGLVIITAKMAGNISVMSEIERIFWASGVPADYGPGIPITGEKTIPVIGAIWFLPCMFIAKIVFEVILKWIENKSKWIQGLIVLGIAIMGYTIGQKVKLPLGIDVALFAIIFMFSGYLIKKYDVLNKKYQAIAVVAMILWSGSLRVGAIELSARFYRPFPDCIFSVLGAIGGSYIIFVISHEVIVKCIFCKKILEFCGKHSLFILCVHHLEGYIINWEKIVTNIYINTSPFYQGVATAVLRIIFVVGISYLCILLKKRGLILMEKIKAKS